MTKKNKSCEWCKTLMIIIFIIVSLIALKVFVEVYYVDKQIIKNYDNSPFWNSCVALDKGVKLDDCVCINVEYTDSVGYYERFCNWDKEAKCSCKQTDKDMKFKFK